MAKIFSGERFLLSDEKYFLKIISGKVEVYAVAKDAENFHQEFIMKCTAGEAVFPALDVFEVFYKLPSTVFIICFFGIKINIFRCCY